MFSRRVRNTLLVALLASFRVAPVAAQDYETIWVDPGQNVDVYWQINLAGTVYVAADVDGAAACLDYWWITWPLGRVEQLGQHCGRKSFDLPGLGHFSIGDKLRAGVLRRVPVFVGQRMEGVARRFPNITF